MTGWWVAIAGFSVVFTLVTVFCAVHFGTEESDR